MMRCKHSLPWMLLPLLFLTAESGAAEPALELDPGRRLVLTRLPPILEDEEVNRQLTTGLTTTFLFRLDLLQAPGGKGVGGGRIGIRYELWDEVFHLTFLGMDGVYHREVARSMEELQEWWGKLRLVVLNLGTLAALPNRQIRITLEVVPFSHSEQIDAQRWFADAIGRAGQDQREETSRSPEEGEGSLGRVLRVLIATSIQRRALTSYRWTLDVPPERSP